MFAVSGVVAVFIGVGARDMLRLVHPNVSYDCVYRAFLDMFSSTTHTRTIEYYKNCYNGDCKVYSNTCLVYRYFPGLVISDSFYVIIVVICGTHISNKCSRGRVIPGRLRPY